MIVRFRPTAAGEVRAAREWYAAQREGVVFIVSNQLALVLAVTHLRREPGYWK